MSLSDTIFVRPSVHSSRMSPSSISQRLYSGTMLAETPSARVMRFFCGWTAACSRGSFCRTINCEVRFLAAAKSGRLTCYAEAVRMGKTIHVIRARVEDENGTVCADGVYTFRMKQMELPEVQ